MVELDVNKGSTDEITSAAVRPLLAILSKKQKASTYER